MPKVIFIDFDGTEHVVETETGASVMAAALENDISGIVGDCGGSCSCATCHGYVDPAWKDRIDPPSEIEQAMLEAAIGPTADSRLTCQIIMTESLDGLIIRLPESQK